jgi:hypothetical protein
MTCCRTCLHVRSIEASDELILWCRRRRWKVGANECCDLYRRRSPGIIARVDIRTGKVVSWHNEWDDVVSWRNEWGDSGVSTAPGREVETDDSTNHRENLGSSKRPKPGVVEKRSDWLAAILVAALFWSALAAVVVMWLL